MDPQALESLACSIAQKIADQTAIRETLSTDTVEQAMAAVLDQLQPRVAAKYYALNVRALGRVCKAIGSVRICDLTPQHAAAAWRSLYVTKADGSTSTASLSAWGSALHARCNDAERLGSHGMGTWRKHLPEPPDPRERVLVVTDEQYREALRAIRWAGQHTKTWRTTLLFLEVSLRCPFRLTELADLEVSQLDLKRRVVFLRESKTGARPVPLTPKAVNLLAKQILRLPHGETRLWARDNAGRINAQACSKAWTRIRREYSKATGNAAIADVRFHDLRHFIITLMLDAGAPLRIVMSAAGHKSPVTTERYYHGRVVPMVEALATMDRLLEGVG